MANIAIFRINYKSDFILTLNSDAGWATPFCIKFWTDAPSQAYFVGFDGETYTHCAPVEGEPTKLLVQFDDHHLTIGDLKFQIGYHFTVDDFPTTVEDEVINQASVIIEVDGEPAQVMLDFNGETAPEIEFSLPAYANEAQRIANEQARIAAEQQRIANEDARIQAEETRQYNEQQRIQHEEERVSEFARLKSESEAATNAANAAATLANEKAQLADDKATVAQAAATLANEKAQLAADKAALAQAAATLANEKAALAQQKATYAQTQGDYAKEQGDYAKAQGDTAQADHVRAEADHTTAADDHSRAEGDHTTAASDHSLAESDHTTAASDHSRAESDHTTAAADHTQAEQDHTRAESDHTRAESDHTAVEVYVDSLGAFDISAYHATGGVLAKYADLTAALGTNGANIPDALRKGGMSVKFVQSSDNKYVQYRCMAQNFSITESDWQGVDSEPKEGSKNLVDSNGVYNYDKSIVRSKFDGAGLDTHVIGNVIRDLLPGHKYRVWVKNTNPDFTGMSAGFKIYIGADASFSHTLASTDYRFNLEEYYDVVMPDGYSEMYIGGRRKVGDSCITYVQDITYSTKTKDYLSEWLVETQSFARETGGNTYSVNIPAGTVLRITNNGSSNIGIEFRTTAGSSTGAQVYTIVPSGIVEIRLLSTCVQIYISAAHDITIDIYGIIGKRVVENSFASRIYSCTTASSTAAKIISYTNGSFTLENCSSFKVRFTNANTASSATLNVESSGAKPLLYNNIPVSESNTWKAGEVVEIYYDPTYNSNTGGFFAMEFLANKMLPKIENTSADYEISDENGNVIFRLNKGHILTKNFNSQNVGDNPLLGKNIVWYGTSIPATGYPEICGSYLNATVHNEAVGGSCCRMGFIGAVVDPDDPRGDKYGLTGINWTTPCTCLSMKQEEKHDLFVNWTTARRKANLKAQYGYTDEEVANVKGWGELLINNPPADIMDSAYDNYRKMSYGLSYNTYTNIEEGLGTIYGKVDKYLNANNFPDLWVFDHGHNDNSLDIETIPTPDNDRRYFIGAMNYIIEHILSYNPRARFIFIGHYENDDAGGSWQHANLCEAQKILADYWNAPLYESWKMFDLSRSRVITTNAYWDNNGEWHQSGFDGTNAKSGTASNTRQVDGVWVHDMSLVQVHMLDGLHPEQTEIKTFIGHSLAKYIYSLIVNF